MVFPGESTGKESPKSTRRLSWKESPYSSKYNFGTKIIDLVCYQKIQRTNE